MRRLLLFLLLLVLLLPAPSVLARDACGGLTLDNYANADCDAVMTADPLPPVSNLAVDFGLVNDYQFLRVVSDHPIPVYGAPFYSYPLYVIDSGFNFVTPISVQENWVEINEGEWIDSDYVQEVTPSTFTGVYIQSEPARPFGWVLVTMYASDHPGGEQVVSQDKLIFRYQLANIYATVTVDGMDWYLIGPGKWIEQRFMGVVRRVANPGLQGRWVAVDLYEQTLVAYENDTMVFATLVSSGLPGWNTNEGTFQVWAHSANAPMSGAEGQADNYRLENVPYALYFDGDISLHGTYWHDGFGYRHSHGCVNLSITDAHWLFNWLSIGNSVYVYYSRPY